MSALDVFDANGRVIVDLHAEGATFFSAPARFAWQMRCGPVVLTDGRRFNASREVFTDALESGLLRDVPLRCYASAGRGLEHPPAGSATSHLVIGRARAYGFDGDRLVGEARIDATNYGLAVVGLLGSARALAAVNPSRPAPGLSIAGAFSDATGFLRVDAIDVVDVPLLETVLVPLEVSR